MRMRSAVANPVLAARDLGVNFVVEGSVRKTRTNPFLPLHSVPLGRDGDDIPQRKVRLEFPTHRQGLGSLGGMAKLGVGGCKLKPHHVFLLWDVAECRNCFVVPL